MAMRVTGMYSGLDTETIIQELVAAKQTKVDDMKKEQTKLEWKQEAWKELNTKIKNFYSNTLENLRFQSSYAKKTTKISDSSIAEIITSDTAMNSVQKLRVKHLAQTGYLTGAEISKTDGSKCTSGTKLADLGINPGSRIEINTNGKTTEIEVTESMTLADFTTALNGAGVNANFDSKTQRLFVGAKESGAASDFSITASNENGTDALSKLGILIYDKTSVAKYEEYAGLKAGGTGEGTAYKAAVDAEVEARLNSYLSKRDNLTKVIEAQNEAIQKLRDKYAEEIGTDDLDALANNADEALDGLKSAIAELEAKIKAAEEKGEPTEESKAQLEKLQKKLEQVEAYKEAQDSLAANKESLAEVNNYINTDDAGVNTASNDLISEVTAWFEDKIKQATSVLGNISADDLESIRNGSSIGSDGAYKTQGQDAEIYLNGAKFTSTENTFEINGLTITCNAETGDREITLTTQDDTSGIYDMIKNFIKEYSSLINEMDKLYNADAAKGYEPLTDDEKYALSEKEVEKWEEKIKESLLRKDSTLSTVSSAFKEIMSLGFSVGGETMYLSDFGIETLGYFEAADNERNAYHILGDADDSEVSSKTNTLKAKISTDPDKVMDFFTQLTKSLYEKTTSLMASVKDYSSAYTVYEDKKMKSDYDDYTKKIKELEEKLKDYEDKWYAKFSAMETAMAKMQSNSSAVTSLLGGL